jgi:hypothetical protein
VESIEMAAPARAGLSVSGGVSGGVITFLAFALAAWLVFFMVKKDKLKIHHLIAVVLAVVVFQLTPLGQLAFGAAMGALDGLADIAPA